LMNKEKIGNFNKMRNDNYEATAEITNKKKKKDEEKPSVVKSEVNKIEDDFFEKCENKFSSETNFKDKNYFENNQWNFEENQKKEAKPVEANEGNFFNVQDFNFDDKQLSGQNNLLIVNSKNKKNINVNEPQKQSQAQAKSLIDFNDIFSQSKTDGLVSNSNTALKNNDVFSMIDFNGNNTTSTNTNLNNFNFNNQFNTNIPDVSNSQPKFDFNNFNNFNNNLNNNMNNNYNTNPIPNTNPGFNLNYVNTNLNHQVKTNSNNFNFNFDKPQQPTRDILDLGMTMGGSSQFKKANNNDFEFNFK
jgi:hypothetical protein